MVELAVALARSMVLPEEVADVEQVALLHDGGKVGTPDSACTSLVRWTKPNGRR